MAKLILLFVASVLIGGCASYRYQVSTPDGAPREVKTDVDLVIPATPAEIRVRQVQSRCVFMIHNPGQTPITLDGVASAIVDPDGQSRSIASQLIPPGAFIKLVLPPLREIEPRGPELRIGFGMQVEAPADPGAGVQALYLMYGAESQAYWEWAGEGTISVLLALKQDEKTDRHQFVIQRSKR